MTPLATVSFYKKIKECKVKFKWTLPVAQAVKNPPASAMDTGDTAYIPGLGRSPGERDGNWLQYSCPETPMDRGAWQGMVHRVTQSDRLRDRHTHTLKNTVNPQIYWTAFKSHYLFSLIFVKTHHFPQYITLIFKQMPLSLNGRNQLKIEHSCM